MQYIQGIPLKVRKKKGKNPYELDEEFRSYHFSYPRAVRTGPSLECVCI